MEFQTEEQRRWRELATELRRDWRLVAHLARFDAAVRLRRNLETARDGTAIPAVTWMPAMLGAFVGLTLVIAGAVSGSTGLSRGGILVLVTTAVLAGIALLALGIVGSRNVSRTGERK
jgi:hypothetical protein